MNYGQYIVYTVVGTDSLKVIAARFGVSDQDILHWNNVRDRNMLYANQRLVIYPTVLR